MELRETPHMIWTFLVIIPVLLVRTIAVKGNDRLISNFTQDNIFIYINILWTVPSDYVQLDSLWRRNQKEQGDKLFLVLPTQRIQSNIITWYWSHKLIWYLPQKLVNSVSMDTPKLVFKIVRISLMLNLVVKKHNLLNRILHHSKISYTQVGLSDWYFSTCFTIYLYMMLHLWFMLFICYFFKIFFYWYLNFFIFLFQHSHDYSTDYIHLANRLACVC